MKRNIIYSILFVFVICAFTFGVTYAYYYASSDDDFSGEVASGVTTMLRLDKVYKASKLVPLSDNLVPNAISKSTNKCIDKNGYEVCSLYKIVLNNSGSSEELYGYVRTTESTYITDNLKYQIFDTNYNALTDVMTLSKVADETVYNKKNDVNYSVVSTGTTTYYLVIWLTDIAAQNQSDDYSKTFSGVVGFESVTHFGTENGKIEAGL